MGVAFRPGHRNHGSLKPVEDVGVGVPVTNKGQTRTSVPKGAGFGLASLAPRSCGDIARVCLHPWRRTDWLETASQRDKVACGKSNTWNCWRRKCHNSPQSWTSSHVHTWLVRSKNFMATCGGCLTRSRTWHNRYAHAIARDTTFHCMGGVMGCTVSVTRHVCLSAVAFSPQPASSAEVDARLRSAVAALREKFGPDCQVCAADSRASRCGSHAQC